MKDLARTGNTLLEPVVRFLCITTSIALALMADARAEHCPPTVILAGDPALVSEIGRVLVTRGISIEASACSAVAAQIERRGAELVVDVHGPDGPPIERIVSEVGTAATVIESFVRSDVGTPLLAVRSIPAAAPEVRSEGRSDQVIVRVTPAVRSGVHVFSAFESAYASDRTGWFGVQVGACIMVGPLCPAARFRAGTVAIGSGPWNDALERRSSELLVGLDIPFAIGGLLVSPGFAAGLGGVHTRGEGAGMRSVTGGIHADVHATVSVPITRRLALDLSLAGDLTQETSVEVGSMEPLPPEPWGMVRFGIGLRYGVR